MIILLLYAGIGLMLLQVASWEVRYSEHVELVRMYSMCSLQYMFCESDIYKID